MKAFDLDSLLASLDRPLTISYLEETGSTNDDLKRAALSGAPDYTGEIAGRQLGGRGREGRTFFSEGGLYMSLLLPARPDVIPFVTHLAAVAVALAVRELTGETAKIKWVNDVFVKGKKVCGILTENISVGESRRLVLGIGVNLNTPTADFPAELRQIAGAVSCDATSLASLILRRFFDRFDAFSAEQLEEEYRALSFPRGTKITVIKEKGSREATVLGLTDALALEVLYEDGTQESLISGEVRLKLLL